MEMDLKFKPGDVVELNSGGPRMTVVRRVSLRAKVSFDDGLHLLHLQR